MKIRSTKLFICLVMFIAILNFDCVQALGTSLSELHNYDEEQSDLSGDQIPDSLRKRIEALERVKAKEHKTNYGRELIRESEVLLPAAFSSTISVDGNKRSSAAFIGIKYRVKWRESIEKRPNSFIVTTEFNFSDPDTLDFDDGSLKLFMNYPENAAVGAKIVMEGIKAYDLKNLDKASFAIAFRLGFSKAKFLAREFRTQETLNTYDGFLTYVSLHAGFLPLDTMIDETKYEIGLYAGVGISTLGGDIGNEPLYLDGYGLSDGISSFSIDVILNTRLGNIRPFFKMSAVSTWTARLTNRELQGIIGVDIVGTLFTKNIT